MLYRCQGCARYLFSPACQVCAQQYVRGQPQRSQPGSTVIDPWLLPDFRFEPTGLLASIFAKPRAKEEKAWRERIAGIVAQFEEMEEPYFVNFVHLQGSLVSRFVGESGYTAWQLLEAVLLKNGFSELQAFPGLTAKLVSSTRLRLEYRRFAEAVEHHLRGDLQGTLGSWIDERGTEFRTKLPLMLYFLWRRGAHQQEVRFSTGRVPLVTDGEHQRLARLCEHIYWNRLIERLELSLEGFDPRSFVTIFEVDVMDGFGFEDFLGKLFGELGYRVEAGKGRGDQGADLFLEQAGKRIVVQAKNYTENVGNAAVQQAVAAREFYVCDQAMVVTNSRFTRSAQELAQQTGVTLIDRDRLQRYLDDYNQSILARAGRAVDLTEAVLGARPDGSAAPQQ